MPARACVRLALACTPSPSPLPTEGLKRQCGDARDGYREALDRSNPPPVLLLSRFSNCPGIFQLSLHKTLNVGLDSEGSLDAVPQSPSPATLPELVVDARAVEDLSTPWGPWPHVARSQRKANSPPISPGGGVVSKGSGGEGGQGRAWPGAVVE